MYTYVAEFIDKKLYNIKCPYSMDAECIVVHNTANDASAKNEIAYMKTNAASVGFHFAVDDIEVRQCIPTDRNAFHAGDGAYGSGNRKGIGIEICYSYCKKMQNGVWVADEERWVREYKEKFKAAEDNAAHFIAELLKERGWGVDRVRKHQDFSGKYCPHRTLDLGWNRFLKKVKSYMTAELETPNDIIWELMNGPLKIEINEVERAVAELETSKADGGSLYWIIRKIVNGSREV